MKEKADVAHPQTINLYIFYINKILKHELLVKIIHLKEIKVRKKIVKKFHGNYSNYDGFVL